MGHYDQALEPLAGKVAASRDDDRDDNRGRARVRARRHSLRVSWVIRSMTWRSPGRP
jgi:hypothetical protein